MIIWQQDIRKDKPSIFIAILRWVLVLLLAIFPVGIMIIFDWPTLIRAFLALYVGLNILFWGALQDVADGKHRFQIFSLGRTFQLLFAFPYVIYHVHRDCQKSDN